MACPCFLPRASIAESEMDVRRAMVPLGEIYEGLCCAQSESMSPEPQFQREFCNFGYARTRCPRFPAGDAADAVRFMIGSDEGSRIRIRFARERNHLPHSHGTVNFEHTADSGLKDIPRTPTALAVGWVSNTPQIDPLLLAQAKSYLASYLKRRPRIRRNT